MAKMKSFPKSSIGGIKIKIIIIKILIFISKYLHLVSKYLYICNMEKFISYPEYNFSVNELGVYLALSRNADSDNICSPSLTDISKIVDISKNTVIKILDKFKKDKLIKIELKNRKRYYTLLDQDYNCHILNSYLDSPNLEYKTKLFILLIRPYLKYNDYHKKYTGDLSEKKLCDIVSVGPNQLHKWLDELSSKGYYNKVGRTIYFDLDNLTFDIPNANSLDGCVQNINEILSGIINCKNSNLSRMIRLQTISKLVDLCNSLMEIYDNNHN